MLQDLKRTIRKRKYLCKVCKTLYRPIHNLKEFPSGIASSKLAITRVNNITENSNTIRIFYFGVPSHANLGDQAQWYCIHKWMNNYYPQVEVIEFTDKMIKDNRFGLIKLLIQKIKPSDLIIFQSGYCTSDISMTCEIMHRNIIKNFQNNKIIIFPQTVNFVTEKEKQTSSQIYNSHKMITFLARDKVSFLTAKEIFSKVKIELYPDIVTSLIGKYSFNNKRDKILFCMRDDSEQYYEKSDIQKLRDRLLPFIETEITDTTIKMNGIELQKNIKSILEQTFNKYSQYKAIITDRYHGTIFSLIAGTPVVVLNSTDHKLSSGVDWFKGVYPKHIYFAENLEKAYEFVKEIINEDKCSHKLDDYFDREYYQKLYNLIDGSSINNG